MKLVIIGAGNIGLITALCFAEKDHQVYCVDIDQTKVNKLNNGEVTIFEPELDTLLATQLKKSNIQFSTQLETFIHESNTIFITVGTPNLENGQVDLSAIESVIENIVKMSSSPKTIILKSTVPPNTNNKFSEKYPDFRFISSPEFLREGSAIYDCLNPDRIIIGSQAKNSNDDLILFKEIYLRFNLADTKYLQMDTVTAEMTKYASNIFLAARISLINELSRVCEKSGGDIEKLKLGLGLDHRIGNKYLNAGIGYGGSCLPKDIEAFLNYASANGVNLSLTKAVKETNNTQIKNFAEKIINYFKSAKESFSEKTLCLWGISFKPETDDLREAPALKLIDYLLAKNYKLHIYDPKAYVSLVKLFEKNKNICVFNSSIEAVKNTNALVVCTEWTEFKNINLSEVRSLLKKPLIFDGRNMFDPAQMRELGFEYISVGHS